MVAALGGATLVASSDGDSASTSVASSGALRLIPATLPDGFVLRRASESFGTVEQGPNAQQHMYYRGPGEARALVITHMVEGALPFPPNAATATGSGYWLSFRPDGRTEVNLATSWVSKEATEAMAKNIGVLGDYYRQPYGFTTMPAGFRLVGDQRDTIITGPSATYAPRGVPLGLPNERRVEIVVGRATALLTEMNRIINDDKRTVTIRSHEALVTNHKNTSPAQETVSIVWFEAPDLAVWVVAYGIGTDEAIAIARGLQAVSVKDWIAHSATTQP